MRSHGQGGIVVSAFFLLFSFFFRQDVFVETAADMLNLHGLSVFGRGRCRRHRRVLISRMQPAG